jgi:hypothetical protein
LRYKIIAPCCKATNIVNLKSFIDKNTGLRCKSCFNKHVSEVQKNTQKIEYDNSLVSAHIYYEHTGYLHIKSLLEEHFIIQKADHYSKADFIVKPKNINTDQWMKVQLKTTQKPICKQYLFKVSKKNYDNHLLWLICIEDKKMWLMNGEVSKNHTNIAIGITTKNKQFEITDNLIEKTNEFYNLLPKYTQNECNTTTNAYLSREQEYYKKRENFKYLNITYPEIEGTVYDLKVNNYKVQDKVCKIVKTENAYSIPIHKRVNTKPHPYEKCDNDYYWIWLQDTNYFYIFPEQILIDNNYVLDNTKDNKCKKFLYMILNKDAWYNNYKYDITDNNLEVKLKNLFI